MRTFIVAQTKNGNESMFQFISARTKSEAQRTYEAVNNVRAAKCIASKSEDGSITTYNDEVTTMQLEQLHKEPWSAYPTLIPSQSRLN